MKDKPLTVSNEYERSLITLFNLTGRRKEISRAKLRHTGLRGLKEKIVSDPNKCSICPENRSLEKAHIFPVWWSRVYDYDNIEDIPECFSEVMMLCPTHHKLYDKNLLNEKELSIMRSCLRDYKNHLDYFLPRLKYQDANDVQGLKRLEKFIDDLWVWWRLYYGY